MKKSEKPHIQNVYTKKDIIKTLTTSEWMKRNTISIVLNRIHASNVNGNKPQTLYLFPSRTIATLKRPIINT